MATTASRTAEDRKERLSQQRRTLPDGPGRLPLPGREGPRDLRRQGEVDPQPRHVALLQQPPRDGQRDRPHRVRRSSPARRRRCWPSRTSSSSTSRASTSGCATTSPIRSSRSRWTRSSRASTSRASVIAATALYFGPYSNAKRVRNTLDLLGKIFLFRSCTGVEPGRRSGSPCLDYFIKRCGAPCVGYVSPRGVPGLDRRVIAFLQGRYREIERDLEQRMKRGRGRAGVRAGRARAQPAARRPLAPRAPARRQRVGRHARRGRRRRRRHGRERPGLPGPRRRAERPPVLLPRQRRGAGDRRRRPGVPPAVLRRARSRSRRRSSSRARSRTSTRSASC